MQLPPTDATGRTVLTVTAHNPGDPRGAVDGQLFGLRLQFGDGPQQAPDLCDLISLLISDAYDPDPPITWHKPLLGTPPVDREAIPETSEPDLGSALASKGEAAAQRLGYPESSSDGDSS